MFSYAVNKIAALGESFCLNRKPKYLEHIDRENERTSCEYTFSLPEHIERYVETK
jgi:hypothetical protein